MSRIDRLIQSYSKYIAVPWREDTAAPQRVVFCVYGESEELRLRAKIEEFEIATRKAKHEWCVFDLTDSFACWLSGQRYAVSYYRKPHLLTSLLPKYLTSIRQDFERFLTEQSAGDNHVVALVGAGTLFGFLKVKDLVNALAPKVTGRLLVFFPGSYENNNYRLLDGYDGWNYLAVPITSDTAP